MSLFVNILNKIKNVFFIPQAPVGLKAIGLKAKYFDKINSFNYSKNRFETDLCSPVKLPYYFMNRNFCKLM